MENSTPVWGWSFVAGNSNQIWDFEQWSYTSQELRSNVETKMPLKPDADVVKYTYAADPRYLILPYELYRDIWESSMEKYRYKEVLFDCKLPRYLSSDMLFNHATGDDFAFVYKAAVAEYGYDWLADMNVGVSPYPPWKCHYSKFTPLYSKWRSWLESSTAWTGWARVPMRITGAWVQTRRMTGTSRLQRIRGISSHRTALRRLVPSTESILSFSNVQASSIGGVEVEVVEVNREEMQRDLAGQQRRGIHSEQPRGPSQKM